MQLNQQEILQFDPIPRKYLRQAPPWYATRTRARSRKLTADALHQCHPDGVPLAIWHDAANRSEMYTFQGCAFRWATVRNAVGPGLALARTWSDGRPLAEIVRTTHEGLRALTGDDGSATRIRDLALFCHGHTTSISYGGGGHQLRIADLEALTTAIADALSPQLRVILYACNTGRNANPVEAAEWMHTSLYEGGSMSFAGALRDCLVGRGKSECEVWAHTTAGHTTYNCALRVFRGRDGVGSPGVAFARAYVHDWPSEYLERFQGAVQAAGFAIRPVDRARFQAAAEDLYTRKFYATYQATCANKELLVDGQRLPMAAPTQPEASAAPIRRRWEDVWKSHRILWAQQLAAATKLPRA